MVVSALILAGGAILFVRRAQQGSRVAAAAEAMIATVVDVGRPASGDVDLARGRDRCDRRLRARDLRSAPGAWTTGATGGRWSRAFGALGVAAAGRGGGAIIFGIVVMINK